MALGRKCQEKDCGYDMWAREERDYPEGREVVYECRSATCDFEERIFERYAEDLQRERDQERAEQVARDYNATLEQKPVWERGADYTKDREPTWERGSENERENLPVWERERPSPPDRTSRSR